MAFRLEREFPSGGSFELGCWVSLADAFGTMAQRYRDGEQSSLRIVSDRTGALVYRASALPSGEPVAAVLERARAAAAVDVSPSQHVLVKSAVESQFETVGSGGHAVSGLGFPSVGPGPSRVSRLSRSVAESISRATPASGIANRPGVQGVEGVEGVGRISAQRVASLQGVEGFSGFGPLARREDRASDPAGAGQVTRAAGNAVEPSRASGPALAFRGCR